MDESLRRQAQQARTEVSAGVLRGAALLERLLAVPFRDRDVWVDELLGLPDAAPDEVELPAGSVPYLPCGVEEILAAVREAPVSAHDELVDLGSGLGRVAMLAHLLTGAKTSGVELQEPLVRRARAACEALGLDAVSFVHADARSAELAGSIFFLYAPFNGEMLAQVLRRLQQVARGRAIVVCAAALELPGVNWLHPRQTSCAALTLYESRTACELAAGHATCNSAACSQGDP